jgi:hypothetical protein
MTAFPYNSELYLFGNFMGPIRKSRTSHVLRVYITIQRRSDGQNHILLHIKKIIFPVAEKSESPSLI